MNHTFVIANSGAGGGADFAEVLERIGGLRPFELHMTDGTGDARRLAGEAVSRGFQRVCAVGGDGTVREVVNGLAPAFGEVTLGIVPRGTGNDLARSLGIPSDASEAVALIREGSTRGIDVCVIDTDASHYFVNAASAGFGPKVQAHIDAGEKASYGSLAYPLGAARAVSDMESYDARFILDESRIVEARIYGFVAANSPSIAGGVPVAPEALVDDGKIDPVLFPALPALRAGIAAAELVGFHGTNSDILIERASKVEFHSVPDLSCNADGDLLEGPPQRLTVLPRALSVFCRPATGTPTGSSAELK